MFYDGSHRVFEKFEEDVVEVGWNVGKVQKLFRFDGVTGKDLHLGSASIVVL